MAFRHRLLELLAIFDDSGLDHLPQQVVSFPCALADSGEDRESVVLLGDIVDELLDEHCLADSGPAEKSDLAAFKIRFKEVYDLDAGIEHFLCGLEIFKLRRFTMDRQRILHDKTVHPVYGLTDDIHDTPANLRADRHLDRFAGAGDFKPPAETVSGIHGHAADSVLTDVLLNLDYKFSSVRALDLERIIDGWQILGLVCLVKVEMDIDYRADDL